MEFLCVRFILPMMLLLSVLAVRAGEVHPSNVNPALLYWQAFSAMEDLSSADARLLSDFINRSAPLNADKIHALLAKHEKALKRFRKAAASTANCDWGLSYEDGPHLPLPHLAKIQTLSRLALLKADILFEDQETDEGIEWLLSVHRAARHCGSGDLIIPVMSQFQMEQSVIRAAATRALHWDATRRQGYLSKWKALSPLHSVKDAIKGELHFIAWLENFWLEDLSSPIPSEIPDDGTMTAEEKAEAEKMLAQFTPENIKKWIQEMRDMLLKMQGNIEKPWLEGNPELLVLQSEYRNNDNLLLQLASPLPLHKVNDLSLKTVTLSTMFQAALEHGPLLREDNMGSSSDAYTHLPLTLAQTKDHNLVISISSEALKKIGTKIELTLPLPERK